MQSETRSFRIQDAWSRSTLNYLAGVTALTAVYFLSGWVSLRVAFVQDQTSPLWLPAGIAIGALVLWGRRYVVAVFAGAFAINYFVMTSTGDETESLENCLLASLGIGTGNVIEALTGLWLVKKRAAGRRCLERVGTVLRFVVYGALLPPLASTTIGVTSLILIGDLPAGSAGIVCSTWYTGNVVGILTIAPLIFCVSNLPSATPKGRLVESVVQLIVVFVVSQAIWGFYLPEWLRGLPQTYMTIPLVLWAALRLGQPVTIVSILLLSAIAIAGTVRGDAVFPGPSPNLSLLYLQTYVGIITVMGLAVSALVTELRRINDGLERAVEERTVRLERLLREKDEFLSIAAHDLQSPLAGFRNLLQLLRKQPSALAESDRDGVVAEMENTVDGMLERVKRMLDTRVIEDHLVERTPSDEDLGCVLEECIRVHRPNAVAKDIAIDLKLPDEPIQAVILRDSLEHVLGNLISNAIKYSPSGSRVRVRLSRKDTLARFEIEDKGPGIPRGQLAGLFRKFQRSTAEPTGGENSTGLGLYIAGRKVDQLGGEIRCRSIEGEGACFIVDLPVCRDSSGFRDPS